ncbi:MAG TPA: hypothetical protein DDY71_16605 [Spirochaetia bacterium]|nr:MAG: hypothetical protein A2Y29_03555 [Spirochaetes bacterium GWE2_31_10]HBD94620.1 hypothetical protein [Spirochaetia bacterium]HBI39264.1 hypothetical protein [Spirochaetia bacterium]
MNLSKIYGAIIVLVGAMDLFFAYKRLSSGFGKFMSKFDKIEEVTIVLLISGVVCLVFGVLELLDRK